MNSAPNKVVDQVSFKQVLARNIVLPIATGVASAILFLALILNLLASMNWVEHTVQVISNATEITKLAVDMQSGLRGFLLTGNDAFMTPYTLAKPKISANIDNLSELVADNPAQVERLHRIQSEIKAWITFAETMIDQRRKNQDYYAEFISGKGKVQFDEIRNELNAFVDIEQRLRKERVDSSRNTTIFSLAFYLLFIIGLSLLIGFYGRRELLRLSGSYNGALEKHQQYADTLEQQSWLRTGQAELAEMGVGQLALPELGRAALDFLARYLGAVVGALYIRQDDGSLHRFAAYGYDKESERKGDTVTDGEGLVGQAAIEGRVIHLQDLPDDYIKVNSALGSTPPRNLVIVPLDNDGKINGVVELGFIRNITPMDLELLDLIAGNMGTAIETTLSRQRLADVLSETQQLNEELQVQQEELRTANEELDEQSRVLEESQANLENQRAELEQTNEQLADQAMALDQRNAALRDIQEELRSRAQDLERASQYKSEFLANMSHELRTPLNSSLILAKMLSENSGGNLTEEQVKFAETIYSAGNDLLTLINDILDISKIEAGKLDFSPDQLPLNRLTESLKQTFSPLADQKKLAFTVEMAAGLPASIVTDRQRLEQILKNLLSNAIKFTESGTIRLSLSQKSTGSVSFTVQDTGIGINAEHQETIFDAFRQADGTISRRYGGSGLGLSISRDLARLLGGTISLESTAGKGSTFTLTIPTAWTPPSSENLIPGASNVSTAGLGSVNPGSGSQPSTLQAHIVTPPAEKEVIAKAPDYVPNGPVFADDRDDISPNGRTVLVIEDEQVFARILYDLAHELQYRCLVAHTAEDGLQFADHYQPDAILLDMRLPDQSGLSVLQQLKENTRTRHIPVHIVSGSDNTEAALHLGAIGYAIKPTTRDELTNVFHRLEEKFTQKIKRVLLVEDDERQRESMHQLISDTGVEITAVATGEEALELLRTTIFDCMIIDLKLPDMQGNELLQQMSSQEICSFPPVIVYTGRDLSREEESELLKYSRSIIIKGARSPERLLDEVTLFLHSVESQLSSERQTMLKTVRSRERVFDGRKILLVDDDVRNIFALTSALEQKGILVEVARNGLEAISQLDAIPDIDLVLMDIMMPEMDGLEATRRIRQDPRFKRLPIIAITAKAMKDDQEQCLRAGTNDYLAKPIDLLRLHSLLRVWMPNSI